MVVAEFPNVLVGNCSVPCVFDLLRRSTVGVLALLMPSALIFIAMRAWHQTTLHDDDDGGDFGGAARTGCLSEVPALTDNQAAYIESLDAALVRYSTLAAQLRGRFVATGVAGIVSAGGVPIAIAAGLPGWMPAVLGGIAAVSQGVEQLLQNQKRATKFHLLAVELGRLRRSLRYKLGKTRSKATRDALFDSFVAEAELVLESGAARVLAVENRRRPTQLPPRSCKRATASDRCPSSWRPKPLNSPSMAFL